MKKLILLGDEAVAQGAIDGGMSGVYAYPGTPSTEITEYVQRNSEAVERKIHSRWSANEKTAMEAALGMSYAGKRAMVCMKHVGLNVAADAFINSGITGVNGGLVVAVADDPSMHSSQNEQDSRFYAKFAMIPILEPVSQQEAYEMAYKAFYFSEQVGLPVMLRLTTRISHSRAVVQRLPQLEENQMKLPANKKQFILLPTIARQRYKSLLSTQPVLEKLSEESEYNTYFEGKDNSKGIIACGLGYNYVMENLDKNNLQFSVLKIGQYPIPRNHIQRLYDSANEILVVEEGAPIVEELLRGFMDNGKSIKGRMDGTLPRDGELNPNLLRKALGMADYVQDDLPTVVADRPPGLCKGCPHIDSYNALNEALKEVERGHVFADIGCYTLGALEPYRAIDTCVDMGASITMAKGAADAGMFPAVAVIGDSTFTHSGITGLIDAVNENSNIMVVVTDNYTTGMTGGQESSALGKIEDICKGVGVDPAHIRVFTPLHKNHDKIVEIYREELAYNGVSVVIPRRECIITAPRPHAEHVSKKISELKLTPEF